MDKVETTDNTFFRKPIITWYLNNYRDLPWRETTDPYKIWISEIILQQTRVAQGLEYYNRFISVLPTIKALAEAQEDTVMRLWQGLGYYSRARNLMISARQIMEQYNGIFPCTYKEIASLKGIGPYTAAAIASFAYEMPYAAVDGNVYRILSRIFNIDTPIDSTEGKKTFAALAQELLDRKQPALFNQATMELGATVCTPKNPDCNRCPINNSCLALREGTFLSLPVKQSTTKVRSRYLYFIHCCYNKKLILQQQNQKDIWQGLYQLPVYQSEHMLTTEEFIKTSVYKRFAVHGTSLSSAIILPKHQLSHQTIYATIFPIEVDEFPALSADEIIIDIDNLDNYALPRLLEKYFTLEK